MIVVLLIISYLIGSIPFGVIVGKFWQIDVRQYGSGNIGATNVFRTLGFWPGLLVFGLDLLKGTAVVLLGQLTAGDPLSVILGGLAAVLGHSFPVWLKFRGGRGVATALGILLGITPDLFFVALTLFTVTVALTRYVSVGSVLTSLVVAVSFFLLAKPLPYSIVAGLVVLIIVVRHLSNIQRLLQGSEPRI